MWTDAQLAALSDDLLIEELLVALALENSDTARLTREVIRRGLVEQAAARAREKTANERRRLG